MTLSVDLAATIAAVTGLITAVGTLALQVMSLKQMRKSNDNGRKLDENTKLTADIHAATAAIAEATGTHQTLKDLNDH